MPLDVCVQLAKRIRELRRKWGWRQIDLAEYSEFTRFIPQTWNGERAKSDFTIGDRRPIKPYAAIVAMRAVLK